MAIRNEDMQILVRIAQMLRDLPCCKSGTIQLQNGHYCDFDIMTISLFNRDNEVVLRAPVNELAALTTERWG